MRKFSAVLLAIVAIAKIAWSDWRIVSSESESSGSNGAFEHRHVVLLDASNSKRADIDLCLFAPRVGIVRVIDNGQGRDSLADAMNRENCVVGVNGGYFDPEFKPIGLRIIDGAITSPLRRARLLTGVLGASPQKLEIVRLSEFSRRRKFDAAIQCGPFLIDVGARVRRLDQTRSARRTFAAMARNGKGALGISSDLTLAQLADALSRIAGDFKIWRAINLDGGSSSAFWFRRAHRNTLSISEQKSVRDFVGVAAE